MSAEDRLRWDGVYAERGSLDPEVVDLPTVFKSFEQEFPTGGQALELACGSGRAAVWMARRGLDVLGVDASVVAIEQSRQLAEHWQVAERCRFEVVDLDHGLPPGPPADVVICHRFRAPLLNAAVIERLAPGGLLAVAVLSEVDAAPGPYRAVPGELVSAFATLRLIGSGEGQGIAWLVARKV
ncbi:MAG: class I SAM-dependent methyltransferase [Mycobacterium sp.]